MIVGFRGGKEGAHGGAPLHEEGGHGEKDDGMPRRMRARR